MLVELPQAGPLTYRSQRTGRPAVAFRHTPDGDWEPLDARTARQRWAFDQTKDRSWRGLVDKLTPPDSGLEPRHWPRNLDARESDKSEPADAFPFLGDDRYIAVVHADGNGLGQLLMDLEKEIEKGARQVYLSAFYQVSTGIEQATQRAAKRAVEQHLLPHRSPTTGMMPARPIVLGGDDLTMIVRADLALGFTCSFLAAFEQETEEPMRALRDLEIKNVPERLTACAGIAYIKASQPFYLGAHLAEGITDEVKRQAKREAKRFSLEQPRSSLAWHRVTTAMIDDYGQALKQELTIGPAANRFRNTLGAYAVRTDHKDQEPGAETLPDLEGLLALQRLLERPEMARGPTRQLLTLIGQSPEQARAHYKRWRGLMGDPANGKEDRFKEYKELLTLLIGSAEGLLPYRPAAEHERDAHQVGPLGDLHALMAVKNRAGAGIDTAEEEHA